jgi:hypothetical protein
LRQLDRQFVTIKSCANDLFLLQAGCRSAANPPPCVLQGFDGSLATIASNARRYPAGFEMKVTTAGRWSPSTIAIQWRVLLTPCPSTRTDALD